MSAPGGIAALAKEAEERGTSGKSLWALGWERFRRKKLAMGSLAIILVFYLGGIVGLMLPRDAYRAQNLDLDFQPAWIMGPYCAVVSAVNPNARPARHQPTLEHPLGTDRLGRDLFSRTLRGMGTSVIVSLAAILTGSIFIGVTLGALAGFLRGWVDIVLMRVGEIFLAFPGILLIVLISATVRPRMAEWVDGLQSGALSDWLLSSGFVDYIVVFGALAVVGWVGIARMIRGQIFLIRELDYVSAAHAIGAPARRIVLRHILPNTFNIIIIMLSTSLGGAIGSELVLSWLGVGIQPPTPSLGVMIWQSQSQSLLLDQFSCTISPVLLSPMLLVSVVFFCFALLGDGLNDAFNPRAR